MLPQLQTPSGTPDWSSGSSGRLVVSMLLASLVVAAVLSVLRLPQGPGLAPVVRLLVEIVREEAPREDTTRPPAANAAESRAAAPAPRRMQPGRPSAAVPDPKAREAGSDRPRNWDAAREAAIDAYLERLDNPPGVNPNMDALRREFAGRYQPPTREPPRPVWENVERDTLGRSVLSSGNCWRVIDDPNVGSQEAFREFGQYLVLCSFSKRKPRELPWVAVIRDRYPYLKYPDGERPAQAAE